MLVVCVVVSLLVQAGVIYLLWGLRAFDRKHPDAAFREYQLHRNCPVDLPLAVTVCGILAALSAPLWLVSHWGVGLSDAVVLIAAWFSVLGAPRQG